MVEDTVGGRAVLTETWTEAGIVTECTASTTTTDKTAETTSMAEQRISETRTEKGKIIIFYFQFIKIEIFKIIFQGQITKRQEELGLQRQDS